MANTIENASAARRPGTVPKKLCESEREQIAQFGAAGGGAQADPDWRQIGGSARGYQELSTPLASPVTAEQQAARPYVSACRINGAPAWGQAWRLRSWFMPQNFLYPQRDQ